MKFTVDLGSGLRQGKPTIPCDQEPTTRAVQVKSIVLRKGRYVISYRNYFFL